jgi:hypothetical protein
MNKESDYFQFKEITTIQPTYLDKFTDYLKVKYFNKKLIGIKMLKYDRNSKEIFYKAKYYHDLNKECFYTIVYPYALFDKVLNVFYRKFGKFD